jgi:hypothetical protein
VAGEQTPATVEPSGPNLLSAVQVAPNFFLLSVGRPSPNNPNCYSADLLSFLGAPLALPQATSIVWTSIQHIPAFRPDLERGEVFPRFWGMIPCFERGWTVRWDLQSTCRLVRDCRHDRFTQCHHQSRYQSCRATRRSLVHTDARAHAWRKTIRRNRSAPAFSSPSSRQNPHSARCSAAPTSRNFVPWRFSDAGRRSAWIASSSRRPKTCTLHISGQAEH